jgi:hypothetical protein
VWANRQVLNAENWSKTSTALLDNEAIRTQVANYLVDQIYANVDVAGTVRSALPTRLQPLAGEAAGALQNLAQRVAFEFLGHPRVQQAWKAAQKLTAQQFINIVEGNSKLVKLTGNAVYIDLRPMMGELTQRLGLPSSVVQSLPPGAGRIRVMSSNQISTVQNAVDLVHGLTIVLPAVALLLFALAVYLSAGRRRHMLLVVGVDLVIAGLLVLVVRNVAGHGIVNSLVSTDAGKPAAQAAWTISTAMLRDIAEAVIIFALAVLLAASLASPRRPAAALRRAAAPWFRERPGVAYAVIYGLLLLIVLWGPIPATRKLIPVLIMAGLVFLGTEALRRQTAEEFPDAQIGDTFAGLRARRGGGRQPGPPGPPQALPAQPPIAGGSWPPVDDGDRLGRLERLTAIWKVGGLTDEEFAAEKAAVLRDGP